MNRRFTYKGQEIWLARFTDDEQAVIETKKIIDYDDDGRDDDGAPIMRPIYERLTVPVSDLTPVT